MNKCTIKYESNYVYCQDYIFYFVYLLHFLLIETYYAPQLHITHCATIFFEGNRFPSKGTRSQSSAQLFPMEGDSLELYSRWTIIRRIITGFKVIVAISTYIIGWRKDSAYFVMQGLISKLNPRHSIKTKFEIYLYFTGKIWLFTIQNKIKGCVGWYGKKICTFLCSSWQQARRRSLN